MITGIGIDLEQIDRFQRLLTKDSFVSRVYSAQERHYIRQKSRPEETAAGIYCAKEALAKALSSGLFPRLFQEAEVLHNEAGAPLFSFSGTLSQKVCASRCHLSISHSAGLATAIVILEDDTYER